MQSIHNLEIPMTKELQEFFTYRYQGQANKLVDEFLIYLNTQKKAYEPYINNFTKKSNKI